MGSAVGLDRPSRPDEHPAVIVRITLVLGVLALAVTGCTGDDDPVSTESDRPPSARVFTAAEVRVEFRRSGLPLTEHPVPLHRRELGRVFRSRQGGPIFRVNLYRTVEDAATSEGVILYFQPPGYSVRGKVEQTRKGNVVVLYEDGRPVVVGRLNAALQGLR